ncbi:MAG: AAA family ATPase [Euryarchaeota archaeon]|nr:AAA family ATPase [Euryarchaeota archaeon]
MQGARLTPTGIVGRARERDALRAALARAVDGRGGLLTIEGEAGVGKTRLGEEFRALAGSAGFAFLYGSASLDSGEPFMVFSRALRGSAAEGLFASDASARFAAVFAVDDSGALLSESAGGGSFDTRTLAGTLGAVQSFVRDSFGGGGGLGRLDFGDTTILIEHGDGVHIAAVLAEGEADGMREALRDAAKTMGGAERRQIADSVRDLATRSFPLRRSLEGVKLETERLRIADGVLQHVSWMAKGRPLALLAEDLHWSDEGSLFVLSYLARNIRDQRVAIVATLRPGEGGDLARALDGMASEGTVERIMLDRLGATDVAQIIDSVFSPNSIPSEFKSRVHADCQGNAFFVLELMRQMSADGSIALRDGAYALARPDYAMPGSVEEVVARRLDGLGMEAMSLAEYASCIGREFPVAAAASLQSLGDPEGSLAALADAHIVARRGETAEFTHAFFHEYVYRNIAGRWKASHHRSLGEYYEREHAADLDAVAYELARHFYRGGESRKAACYCFKARGEGRGGVRRRAGHQILQRGARVRPALGTVR